MKEIFVIYKLLSRIPFECVQSDAGLMKYNSSLLIFLQKESNR